ncbi:hypothetical protein BKA82DRAFT_4017740 [Pisolithus tinctorius]|nr:hypothetical protein BKA82DRAFT_4017740 [Pisolithus tinctorius]
MRRASIDETFVGGDVASLLYHVLSLGLDECTNTGIVECAPALTRIAPFREKHCIWTLKIFEENAIFYGHGRNCDIDGLDPMLARKTTRIEGMAACFRSRFTSLEASRTFYDALDVAKGPSYGTAFALIYPYTLLGHYWELEFAAEYGVEEGLLRVGLATEVGIERMTNRKLSPGPFLFDWDNGEQVTNLGGTWLVSSWGGLVSGLSTDRRSLLSSQAASGIGDSTRYDSEMGSCACNTTTLPELVMGIISRNDLGNNQEGARITALHIPTTYPSIMWMRKGLFKGTGSQSTPTHDEITFSTSVTERRRNRNRVYPEKKNGQLPGPEV